MNKPKQIGTAAETATVRYLVSLEGGFPGAERRALKGTYDEGDITGTPGVCWEVKGGDAARDITDGRLATWMGELAAEVMHSRSRVGVLVAQRRGVGAPNAGRWWAYMRACDVANLLYHELPGASVEPTWPVRMELRQACELLRHAGYGSRLEAVAA